MPDGEEAGAPADEAVPLIDAVIVGVMLGVMFALGVCAAVPDTLVLIVSDLLADGEGDGLDETLAGPLIEQLGETLTLTEAAALEGTLGYREGVVEPVVLEGVFVADREADLDDPCEAVTDRVLLDDLVS